MVDTVPTFLHGLILSSYLVIAGRFFWLLRQDNKANRACSYLIAIFTLCGISGYGRHIFPEPPWLEILTHVLLIVASWGFVLSGQIGVISKNLNSIWLEADMLAEDEEREEERQEEKDKIKAKQQARRDDGR